MEHSGTVEGVAASTDGKLLATAGSEEPIRLWAEGVARRPRGRRAAHD